jgi:diguanylate cyclase (GGDEF)-like protein
MPASPAEIPMQTDPDTRSEPPRPSIVDDLGLSAQRGEEGLDRVVQLLARIGETPIAAFWAMDRDRPFFAAAQGLSSRDVPRRSALGEHALRDDAVFVVNDALQDPRFSEDPLVIAGPHIRFFAGVPVRGRDRQRIAVLCLMDTQPRSLEPSAANALQDLRVILEDRLRLRADVLHDPQTGTFARRHFDEMADREWRRAMRAMVPVSVVVAELDRVREFGVREGAAALDRGLRATALAVQYSLHRPGDCVCRYDDTRFVILLPGTQEHGAAETAERVRSAVEALLIPFAGTATGTLTLSAGVETVHSDLLSRTDLSMAVHTATLALRDAQSSGGNRWILAGTERPSRIGE